MRYKVALWLLILLNGQSVVMEQQKQASADDVVFTVLYDNLSVADTIIADQGFSCLIETGSQSVLFDVGKDPEIFFANAEKMGANLSGIGHVVVSHLHDDHMGGLFDVLPRLDKPVLVFPFSYPQMRGEPLGEQAEKDFQAILDRLKPMVSRIDRKNEPVRIGDRLMTTGTIEDGTYEQALIVPTSKGSVIITGCAHPGILEIVRRAKEVTKQDVCFVLGGFHLVSTDPAQVRAIAQELRKLTKYVGTCHCTGEKAQGIFKDIFKEDCIDIKAGMKLNLGDDKLK